MSTTALPPLSTQGWLGTEDIAERLGITKQAVHKQIISGRFKTAHTIGHPRPTYVVSEDEVDEMIEDRARRAAEQWQRREDVAKASPKVVPVEEALAE